MTKDYSENTVFIDKDKTMASMHQKTKKNQIQKNRRINN